LVLALAVAIIFTPYLEDTLIETKLANKIQSAVSSSIDDIEVSDDTEFDYDKVKDTEEFNSILDIIDVGKEEVEKHWEEWKNEPVETAKNKLEEFMSKSLKEKVASFTAFVILFFGTIIILKIVVFIIDKIFVLPVLKQANTVLGIVLGIVLAVVRVGIFIFAVSKILPYFRINGTPLVSKMDVDSTILFKWFASLPIISKFI